MLEKQAHHDTGPQASRGATSARSSLQIIVPSLLLVFVAATGTTDALARSYSQSSPNADLNGDGIVNKLDVAVLRTQFGTRGPDADLNGDGIVNNQDVAIMRRQFGQSTLPLSSSEGTAVSTGTETSGSSGTSNDTAVDPPAPVNSVPVAVNDTANADAGTATVIPVLANDSNLADTPIRVSVAGTPAHGTATVSDNAIAYTPEDGYAGTDSFVYKLTDSNGDVATATATVNVTCSKCRAAPSTVKLSWSPNSSTVDGYTVFFGPSATAANQQISQLPLNSGLLNPNAPSVTYSSTDLNLQPGDPVCFAIKAYNSVGSSAQSTPACGTL